jgi:DNA-directed RNA polymerase subunit F
MNVIKTDPITMAEANDILSKREKEGELKYEQKTAMEHLTKFTKIKQSEAKKLIGELSNVLRMSPETLVQIVNLMPGTADELRMIFSREKFSLKEDEIKSVLEIIKKFK